VFLDVTDIIEYNVQLLGSDPSNAFFHLDSKDPTQGWSFDASKLAGYAYPPAISDINANEFDGDFHLRQRLFLASHLAQHVRLQLESDRGYTCTIGVSTSKLLSKLIGNVNKPRAQTTLLPPYVTHGDRTLARPGNIALFLDDLEVGKIPSIGFKTASKLREFVLNHPPTYDGWNLDKRDAVLVRDVKAVPGIDAAVLERVFTGPGIHQGIGQMIWNVLHGIDDTPVAINRELPKQISIEDSYGCINSFSMVTAELIKLSRNLILRMRTDLFENDKWKGRPKNLRLSTRPSRATLAPEDQAAFFHTRLSRSTQIPAFLFIVTESIDILAARVVNEHLLPLFRKMHPQHGWALSLLNVAAVNIENGGKEGRNIQGMFQNQEAILKDWRVTDVSEDVTDDDMNDHTMIVDGDVKDIITLPASQSQSTQGWIEEESTQSGYEDSSVCSRCGIRIPSFALIAHERYHGVEQD
jgi:DNA polymerase iota